MTSFDSNTSQPLRDAEWIRHLHDGDERALSALVRTYMGWLVEVAVSVVGSRDLAQDVVQDVFMRLWDMRLSLHIRGSVAGYLYQAVRNRARDVLAHEQAQQRLQQRTRAMYDAIEPSTMNEGESRILHTEFGAALDAALNTLQPRMREIFLMRVDAGMSYKEIASILGIGVPTVHVQMSRATKALARQLVWWVDPDRKFDL